MICNIKTKTLLLLALYAQVCVAVKMHPHIKTVTQRDGTTLRIKGHGDQDFNYLTTTDGVLLYQDGTDYYIAKVESDGTIRSTGILAHEDSQRTAEEREQAAAQDMDAFTSNMRFNAEKARIRREPMEEDATLLQHTGSPRVPVILVEFSDCAFSVKEPYSTFHKYLNATELFDSDADPEMGLNYGSVKRYFSDMSFGLFTPQFDVYGPVTLSQPLAYYGAGNSSYEDMSGLFADACSAVDDEVDFSQYDSNDDGYIDLVYIIYAGYSQSIAGNSTDCIYPKSGTLSLNTSFDGKQVRRYGVNNELNGTPADQAEYGLLINGIGLFCHEFSHCLGLPDMYPAAGSAAERCINQNLDYWDLMDAGEYTFEGYCPTEYTAWERERLGWMEIDTLLSPQDIVLTPLSAGGTAYRILNDNDETGHEYYIVENVQNTGWNKHLPGHGMLVFHVDYSDYYFSLGGYKVNSTLGHPRMSIIAADGMFMPEYFLYTTITEPASEEERLINSALIDKYLGVYITSEIYDNEAAGDPYPGIDANTQLTDDSTPSAWVYNGDYMGKPITEITESESDGTVSFKFMGGESTGIEPIVGDSGTNGRIYSIDGRYMGTDTDKLAPGLYIIDKKKVVL